MMSDERIERLARAMTTGDPDHLLPLTYNKVVGYRNGGPPQTIPQTDMIPAWKFHVAEARSALSSINADD